jgi:uncharacterized protein (DUF427 family)
MEQTLSTTSKPIKFPGPDHPITIERNPNRVVISVAGRVIADTRDALTLRESTYPPVQYIPRKDVDMTLLERTDHATYCPYKGDASYFSIPSGGDRSANAVWTYEAAYAAVALIKDHLAFYPDRVDVGVNSKDKSGEYAGERLFLYDSQLDNLTLLENPQLFQYELDTRQRLDEVDRAKAGIKSYIALCVQPGRGF